MSKSKESAKVLTQHEFVEARFKEMLSHYPAIEQMNAKSEAGILLTVYKPPLKPCPYLDLVAFDKPHIAPKRMREAFDAVQADRTAVKIYLGGCENIYGPGTWAGRSIERPLPTGYMAYQLGHSVVSFTPLGDKRYNFESPVDDYVDATIVAGQENDGIKSFLLGKGQNGKEVVLELEDFCLLSLDNGTLENKEFGSFVVFDKAQGILFADVIEGCASCAESFGKDMSLAQRINTRKSTLVK